MIPLFWRFRETCYLSIQVNELGSQNTLIILKGIRIHATIIRGQHNQKLFLFFFIFSKCIMRIPNKNFTHSKKKRKFHEIFFVYN
jgi:hypothetical protein